MLLCLDLDILVLIQAVNNIINCKVSEVRADVYLASH